VQALERQDGEFEINPLLSLQSVKLAQERCDMLCGGVHDQLQPTNEMLWNASQCRVAVIQPREDA
jgi:hypothetical protein